MESKLILIQKKIEEMEIEFLELKKSIPKYTITLLILVFIFPYFPLRHGSLVTQYGYWNAVIFTAVIFVIVFPLWFYYKINKIKNEITQLENDLEIQKRLAEIERRE